MHPAPLNSACLLCTRVIIQYVTIALVHMVLCCFYRPRPWDDMAMRDREGGRELAGGRRRPSRSPLRSRSPRRRLSRSPLRRRCVLDMRINSLLWKYWNHCSADLFSCFFIFHAFSLFLSHTHETDVVVFFTIAIHIFLSVQAMTV